MRARYPHRDAGTQSSQFDRKAPRASSDVQHVVAASDLPPQMPQVQVQVDLVPRRKPVTGHHFKPRPLSLTELVVVPADVVGVVALVAAHGWL